MQTFLVLLLVAAMIATVAMLVRGIVNFLQNSGKDARGEGEGPSEASLRSNKLMQRRIQFQALAVAIIVILLLLAHSKAS